MPDKDQERSQPSLPEQQAAERDWLAVARPAGGVDPDWDDFIFQARGSHVLEADAPKARNRAHRITAVIDMPSTGGHGVILAEGGKAAGFALYVQNGKLVFRYIRPEQPRTNLVSSIRVPNGRSTIAVELACGGAGQGKGGDVTLAINGKVAGHGHIDPAAAGRFGVDTFGGGMDASLATDTYTAPFPFTGKVECVDIELAPLDPGPDARKKIYGTHTAFAAAHD